MGSYLKTGSLILPCFALEGRKGIHGTGHRLGKRSAIHSWSQDKKKPCFEATGCCYYQTGGYGSGTRQRKRTAGDQWGGVAVVGLYIEATLGCPGGVMAAERTMGKNFELTSLPKSDKL